MDDDPLDDPEVRFRSPIMGDLRLLGPEHDAPKARRARNKRGTEKRDPKEKVAILLEINVAYPGGLHAVRDDLRTLWAEFAERAGGNRVDPTPGLLDPRPIPGLMFVSSKLYQCVLSREDLQALVTRDQERAADMHKQPVIFRAWPDYQLDPQIDRSAPTVKADAAWRAYDARGNRIVWAVIDSGIDAAHPHFEALEIGKERRGEQLPNGLTTNLHRDFSFLVGGQIASAATLADQPALVDEMGHGTHVAGIISGCSPASSEPLVAVTRSRPGGGFVARPQTGMMSAMAPACELVSLKVTREIDGSSITSSSAIIRALTYLRNEVNVDPAVLRVHGVNISLGCPWKPDDYAAGQSPLCQAINQLVATGVVVVVSAGNSGARTTSSSTVSPSAILGSITEPAHAEDCIAVGSTHRDAPHAFGITWTSSKGPTLDGRMKPDVVAPGEWVASAASGLVRAEAGFDQSDPARTYAEQSGTSMAAAHVSGVIAAFLSVRPEFIGRPRQVKRLLVESATDLGRERYAQGAGLVDVMRMLANV